MSNASPVFRPWATEWLIRAAIFLVLVPSLVLFGLSSANAAASAGYYGIEPADVQFSVVVFYAAVTSFFALERRFFNYIAVKQYLLLSTVIQVITSYICYITYDLEVLLIFRFMQGMANCATTSICITLIFSRLHSERSREIGYSVFYGILLSVSPFTTLATSHVTDTFDYNTLYKGIIFLYVPGNILLFSIMNNVRLNRKFPLYQVDWGSFIIYGAALCLTGYVLVYGQQYNWLEDQRIAASVVGIVLLFAIHMARQASMKRPYLTLQVFRYRNFKIGALLVFVIYICRGALGVTTSYFAAVLGMDPMHIGYLLLANVLGIILSVMVSSRLVVLRMPMRYIWLVGFLFMLVFHGWMCLLFTPQADSSGFILPLIIQGMGAGMLMTPVIVFMVSSVPAQMGGTAAATGVFFRFTGFCTSIAFINYFSLHGQSSHYNRFQQSISELNPALFQRLTQYRHLLVSRGMAEDQAGKAANALLSRSVHMQTQMRYAMEYYQFICWILIVIILMIALYPYINRTTVNVSENQPAPASY